MRREYHGPTPAHVSRTAYAAASSNLRKHAKLAPTSDAKLNISVDLLHLGGLVCSTLNLLQRRELIVIAQALIIIIDAEAKLDHAVDAAGKLRWFVQVETRSKQRGIEEEPDQVLHSLVGLVGGGLLLQLSHDRMFGVYLHSFLGDHVGGHGVVTHGLCLHDALHVGRPTIFGGGEDAWRVSHARAHEDLFHLVAEHFLHEFRKGLELGLQLLHLLLFILVVDVQTLLRHGLELFPIELLKLLHSILINGVDHVKHLVALLAKVLEERRGRDRSDALASDVVDIVLSLLHAIHVLLETNLLIARLGCLVAHELRHLSAPC